MKKIITILFIAFSIILTAYSCKGENGAEPKETLVDPSSMTWTVDTVFYPLYESFQTLMQSIYVIDSNNIWLCGHCDDVRGGFWRYTASGWAPYEIFNDISLSSALPRKIVGANNNLYIVGNKNDGALLLKWSNDKWNEINTNLNTSMLNGTITGSGSVTACGYNGVMLNYDGYTVTYDTIVIKKKYNNYTYSMPSIAQYNNDIYVLASYLPGDVTDPEWSYYLLKGSFNNWKFVDSFKINSSSTIDSYKFGTYVLYSSSWGKLYSCGPMGLWQWNNNSWESLISNSYALYGIYGVRDDYILSVGVYGKIYFYNGNSWKELTNLIPNQSSIFFRDIWTDGKTIYLVGNINGTTTLIIKGKKKT